MTKSGRTTRSEYDVQPGLRSGCSFHRTGDHPPSGPIRHDPQPRPVARGSRRHRLSDHDWPFSTCDVVNGASCGCVSSAATALSSRLRGPGRRVCDRLSRVTPGRSRRLGRCASDTQRSVAVTTRAATGSPQCAPAHGENGAGYI